MNGKQLEVLGLLIDKADNYIAFGKIESTLKGREMGNV